MWIVELLIVFGQLLYGLVTNQPLWAISGALFAIVNGISHLSERKDNEKRN